MIITHDHAETMRTSALLIELTAQDRHDDAHTLWHSLSLGEQHAVAAELTTVARVSMGPCASHATQHLEHVLAAVRIEG